MFDKLSAVEARYERADERASARPAVQSDPAEYRKAAKALSELEPLVQKYREYKAVEKDIADARGARAGADAEMRELAQRRAEGSGTRHAALVEELRVLLVPKDPNDEKNVILEIRAGTGGDEAALFAADLFRMYSRFAERRAGSSK